MNTHRIHRVAKLTGLSKDVIRVWERRFGLLKPTRGANRYRNYSDEDVALLRFLKEQLEEMSSMSALLRTVERAAQSNILLAEDYLARTAGAVAGPRRRHRSGAAAGVQLDELRPPAVDAQPRRAIR